MSLLDPEVNSTLKTLMSSRKAAIVLASIVAIIIAVSALITIIITRNYMKISYVKSKEPPCKLSEGMLLYVLHVPAGTCIKLLVVNNVGTILCHLTTQELSFSSQLKIGLRYVMLYERGWSDLQSYCTRFYGSMQKHQKLVSLLAVGQSL